MEDRKSRIKNENRGSRIENGELRIEARESGIKDRESRVESRGLRIENGACQAGSDIMTSNGWKTPLECIGTSYSMVGLTTQRESRKKASERLMNSSNEIKEREK